MDLTPILVGLAANVGAPLVKQILEKKFGPGSGQLADVVIKTIAEHASVPVSELPDAIEKNPSIVRDGIIVAEGMAPELVALYSAGLAGQFGLLQAEQAEGPWQSGWRWGWMYLLAVFWIWVILIVPTVALIGPKVETIDLGVLMTLTSWFIALYMGGHTLKELGKNVIDAVKSWKGGRA